LNAENGGDLYLGVVIFDYYHYIFSWLDILAFGKLSQIFDVKLKRKISTFFILKNIPNFLLKPTFSGNRVDDCRIIRKIKCLIQMLLSFNTNLDFYKLAAYISNQTDRFKLF